MTARATARTRILLALPFAVVALTHLAAQAAGNAPTADLTQVLLMPALAVVAWACAPRRGRTLRWALAALAASWVGDSLPRLLHGDAGFLAMVGGFLLAQVCYLVAFVPWVRAAWPGGARRRLRVAGATYAVALVLVCWWCLPGAGGLAGPLVLYGAVLAAMATCSVALPAPAAVGGALFLASDSMIALRSFAPGYHPPGHDLWVMVTYIAAQALLVLAVLRLDGQPSPATGAGSAEPEPSRR